MAVGRYHPERPALARFHEHTRQIEPRLVGRDRKDGLVDHLPERGRRDLHRHAALRVHGQRQLREVLRVQAHDLELRASRVDLHPARRRGLHQELIGGNFPADLVEFTGI